MTLSRNQAIASCTSVLLRAKMSNMPGNINETARPIAGIVIYQGRSCDGCVSDPAAK